MRSITNKIIAAFQLGRERKYGHDKVENMGFATYLSYRGNIIAKIINKEHPDNTSPEMPRNQLWITDAGWPTVTTKDRLNGIPGVSISQKKGVWYLNGAQWDGKWTKI